MKKAVPDSSLEDLTSSKIPRPAPTPQNLKNMNMDTSPPPPGRKIQSPVLNSPMPSSSSTAWTVSRKTAPIRQNQPQPVPTRVNNPFSVLKDNEGKTDPPPPPFYVKNVASMKNFEQKILQIIEKGKFTIKLEGQNLRINVTDVESYRKLQNNFMNNNIEYYTYQLKTERAYRVVLKGLHTSLTPEDISAAIQEEGFTVRKVLQCLKTKTIDNDDENVITEKVIAAS